MYRKRLESTKLLDGATSATSSVAYPMSDYDQIFLTIAGDGEWTIKIQASFQDEAPDFSQAAAADNQWTYISVRALEDGTNIDGTTWITLGGTDAIASYLVNTPWVRWLGATITSYTSGSVDVSLNGFIS
jgi:hypothetical protein